MGSGFWKTDREAQEWQKWGLANGGRGKTSNDEHRQIMEAIKEKNKDKAEELANKHMINAYDNMVKNGLYNIYGPIEDWLYKSIGK